MDWYIMDITIENLIKIENPEDYKIHFAVWNGSEHPLDVFVRSRDEWQGWNSWRSEKRDRFSRKYIFSMIRYHQHDKWLFGGIFEVKARHKASYTVELLEKGQEFIGRLLVHYQSPGTPTSVYNFEKHYEKLIVSQIFDRPYSGEHFCGYENINHDFHILETIFKTNKIDWKAALEHVKGVYLIVDKKNGKMYVGSAHGDSGIWSRWREYIDTGHGGNKNLMEIIAKESFDYARNNFKFSLLEYYSMKTDDKVIIDREQYWKNVFLSGAFGYNEN
jgi:hypothetical protein